MLRTLLLLSCLMGAFCVCGQPRYDSTYVESYSDQITSRFYFSQKRASILFRSTSDHPFMRYIPNTTFNMGVGVTYGYFTLNLAAGFKFLNPKREEKGPTEYLDLQTHVYSQQWAIDLYGQFYKGYFLRPTYLTGQDVKYYQRPDIKVRELGASVQYVFNNKKFSYRAVMVHSAWQKRSAGSLLVGGEFYLGDIRADSSLIPSALYETPTMTGKNRLEFLQIAPNIGYAYTLVIKKHFFIMGSASTGFSYGINTFKTDVLNSTRDGFNITYALRFSLGYNSEKVAINFMYTSGVANLASENLGRRVAMDTNNYRFVFTYRFMPGPKLKPHLRFFEPEFIKKIL